MSSLQRASSVQCSIVLRLFCAPCYTSLLRAPSPEHRAQYPEPITHQHSFVPSLPDMAKKRKLSSDHLPVDEALETPVKRAAPPPPPESGLSALSKNIRGLIGSLTGSGNDFEVSPVVNGASPAPKHFLSNLISDVKSQGGRFTENFGLLASLAETKLFAGGLADDRKYQVRTTRSSGTRLSCFDWNSEPCFESAETSERL